MACVYTVGKSSYGQQGLGEQFQRSVCRSPIKLYDKITVTNIASGWYGSTYIVTADLHLVVFGHNDYGELGLESYDKCIYIIIEHWYKLKRIPISLMDEIFRFCCTPLIHVDQHQYHPLKIPSIAAKYVSSGNLASHRFIIDHNDEIYGAGNNRHCQILSASEDESNAYDNTHIPKWTKIAYFRLHQIVIKQIACAHTYSLFLSENGKVYARGTSAFGGHACGTDIVHLSSITPVASFGGYKIDSIACGHHHSLFLTEHGNVISCGQNMYGQLGVGNDHQMQGKAHLIDYFAANNIQIVKFECGHHSNVALDSQHRVYSWGFNGEFQCGIDNKQDAFAHECSPVLQAALKEESIVDVKSGSDHVMAKTKQKEYYLWGLNDAAQCLVFSAHTRFVKVPRKYDNDGLDDNAVVVDMYLGDTATRLVVLHPT